jgi:large subunit ribosomal protein L17
MRHRQSGKRLGRNTSHRKAMLRNMVTSLLEHEKITTTDARAKELRPITEKLITMAKRGDLHARRQATEVIRDRKTVAKLFERIAPRYTDRPGGYTRIIKLGHRLGDNAALSMITLVEEAFVPKTKKKAPKTVVTPKPAAAPAVTAAAAPAAAEAAVAAAEAVPAAEPAATEAAPESTPAEGEQQDA